MQQYYVSQSIYSDPMQYENVFSDLPLEIDDTRVCIQNLFLHYADSSFFNITLNENRYSEMNDRYVSVIIKNILKRDLRPLHVKRAPENRAIGICRDTSLLLCSVLRSRGIPARLRSGFVSYFIPGLFLDGYCVEFFDAKIQRWRSVDTRTTQYHIDHYQLPIDFDLTDVPNTKFISAARAWQQCRFESSDSVRFGSRQHRGLFTIRNRLIHDLALLNKTEILIWDVWGQMLSSVITDYDLLDSLAELLLNESHDLSKITDFYSANFNFKVPDFVLVDNPFLSPEWVSLDKH